MNSTSSTKSPPEAPSRHRFDNEKPPPGFEYIFGGFLLLGLLYGALADSFDVLFEDKQQLGLVYAIAMGFVNLTNLFRIQRAPSGALALILGIVLALLTRLFEPTYIGLLVVFAPNAAFLVHDTLIKPSLFRRSQRRILDQISKAESSELAKLVEGVHGDFIDPLIEVLKERKLSSDPASVSTLPPEVQFLLAARESQDAKALLETVIPLLESSTNLSDHCPEIEQVFQDPSAVDESFDRVSALIRGETEASVLNRAALACVFFSAEGTRSKAPQLLPHVFEILRENNDPIVISWIEECLAHFPEDVVRKALTELKLELSAGHFLNVMARWVASSYLDQVLTLLESDDANTLGTAAYIFRGWHERGELAEHGDKLLPSFANVVQRIRSIHPKGENIYADELVADFEQISLSLKPDAVSA